MSNSVVGKRVVINRFGGMADDRYHGRTGECGFCKQFDTLSNPYRLQPLRGMTAHTSNTGIGNLIVAGDGYMYGVGTASGNGRLFFSGYGGVDDFTGLSTDQLSGAAVNYDFLVDYPDASLTPGTNVRKIHWASANLLVASNYSGGAGSATTQALTYSTIGQGFVHPKNKYLYFPYRNATTPFIGVIRPSNTSFGDWSATELELPLQYRVYCLTNYGNYLAIPLSSVGAVSLVNSSVVGLWDLDPTNELFTETIQWGAGLLKVLNNLGGVLVGISEQASDTLQAGTAQDTNAIQIKVWQGGSEPTLVKEIRAYHQAGTLAPTVMINPKVNFIANNRLYFSVTVSPNDGVQPTINGLFSVGKSKVSGEWEVTAERNATNSGNEQVLAALVVGDYVEIVHTAAGTLTKTINGATSNLTYAATSIRETAVNEDMDEDDILLPKKLYSLSATFQPLPSGATVVLKYRVDSVNNPNDWITVATAQDDGSTFIEMPNAAGTAFTDGRNYEFRVESQGGAVVTALAYRYDVLTSLI